MFNLSNKVFSDTEIRLLEKGLDLAPIQNKINECELRRQMFMRSGLGFIRS